MFNYCPIPHQDCTMERWRGTSEPPLRNHPHILPSNCRKHDMAKVLLTGRLKVVQILLERGLIELGQEVGVGGDVVPTDIINQLTLGHMLISVGSGPEIT